MMFLKVVLIFYVDLTTRPMVFQSALPVVEISMEEET